MSKAERAKAIAAGRAYLKRWLTDAEAHGTIYYSIPHVSRSGMTRRIVLATIRRTGGSKYPKDSTDVSRVELHNLWPRSTNPNGDDSATLDAIARDWGFSFKHRAFVVGGCGMDMVFALVDNLAGKAGADVTTSAKEAVAARGSGMYANRVRRESFS